MADQKTGIVATVAIIAAIGSLLLTFTGSPIWGMIVALVAIVAGIVGVVISVSPKVGGGLLSVVSIILGVLDVGIAILGIIGVIIF